MEDIYQDFWGAFLEQTGRPETTVMTDVTYFGGSEEESVTILEQLLSGEKTAVGHCIPAYLAAKRRMPRIGDYTMVTDFYGNPCCILLTSDVTIAPMPEIPENLRRRECPELTPEQWLTRKQAESRDLAGRLKFHYNEEIPLLMETVEMVFPDRD